MNYKVAKKTVEFHQLPLNYLLENVYLPPFQRPENDEHIETIFTGLREYYDEHREVFLPGTISVGRLPDKPKMILFDGQHRIRALERLCKLHRAVCNHLIRIDIYNVQTEEDAQKLYHIINSNKKVDLFDGNIEPFVIPVVQKFFKENFSEYCKASNAPRGINISLETLGKKLQGYEVVKKMGITLDNVQHRLLEPIMALNHYYGKCHRGGKDHLFEEWGIDDFSTKYKKLLVGDRPFYLGLFRNYEWIDTLLQGENYEKSMTRTREMKARKKIPQPTRIKLWQRSFGDHMKGECFCCAKMLMFTEFEAGHIVSVRDGGDDTLANLEIVCRVCNADMGTMNMHSYQALLRK